MAATTATQLGQTIQLHFTDYLLAVAPARVCISASISVCVGRFLLLTTNPGKRPCCWPADNVRQVRRVEKSTPPLSLVENLLKCRRVCLCEWKRFNLVCCALPTYLYNFSFHSACFLLAMSIVRMSCLGFPQLLLLPFVSCVSGGPPVQHSVDCLASWPSHCWLFLYFCVLRHISPPVICYLCCCCRSFCRCCCCCSNVASFR